MLKVIVFLALISWATEAVHIDFCSDVETYYNIYRVTYNSCPCNGKTIGALRYTHKQLQICNGKKYEAVCSQPSKLGTKENPATSCKEILQDNEEAKSGMYWLKSTFGDMNIYCYMEELCGEKGWTMIMKLNGKKTTFRYDSKYWSNQELVSPENARGGLDNHETKLRTYHSFKFDRLCLGMKTELKTPKWQKLNYAADSLYNVIKDGFYRPLSIGRDAWKELVPESSLQRNCNKEGFNSNANHPNKAKVRIGIISNQENDCHTPDSRLGFGGGGNYCGQDDSNTVGNTARCHPDNGDTNIKSMGYIFASNQMIPQGSLGSYNSPGESCKDILTKTGNPSGIYYIGKPGSKKERVYCHMDTICNDNGWTMIMKANGHKTTFKYDSALWQNTAEYNPGGAAGGVTDDQETKLSTYSSFKFNKLCIGMKYKDPEKPLSRPKTNWIKIPKSANSLYSLMKDNVYHPLSLGRKTWKSLISGESSLQPHCNKEGFNVRVDNNKAKARVRIGIIANQENNCASPDSRIGIGGDGSYCGQRAENSVGNEAKCSPDNGDKHLSATGYILAM